MATGARVYCARFEKPRKLHLQSLISLNYLHYLITDFNQKLDHCSNFSIIKIFKTDLILSSGVDGICGEILFPIDEIKLRCFYLGTILDCQTLTSHE